MPSTILSDNGVSSGTSGIKTTGSNDGALALQTTTAGGTATTALTIDTSQNVGVGTASPSYKLSVAGSGTVTSSVASSTGNAVLRLTSSGGFDQIIEYTTVSTAGLAVKDATAGLNRMYIDVNGNVTFRNNISLGNATPTTSGTGITFPATQSASSDANTLDDYEEGTWTFGISFGGGTTGITYAASAGSYTKIGQMVTVRGYMELTNKGSSTGSALITGLPFTINNATANHTACALAMKSVTFADWPMAWASPNSTTVILNESTNAGVQTALTDADFANNSWVMISCSYYTT